ncbi:DegT/DnrJ/EryC1/StrS family aminotransferase [Sulfurospirillum sp. T05]|uniref:DegT/DnrJ/EryC1/StrS family aminotransferase n=1 Tax=Sulfurospirillum tamanense TaxID=2813362 RepID=A0ABS2WUH7_9BACT|nr:DegT/DnrJ/EryC1/StrS family aminotransferase [Sulfurospirillum tamanensis]MBN2964839.1 DegT/DnrJ/EryC1/StrS family aminotransferase [Sulfurospirillum tamanensis]
MKLPFIDLKSQYEAHKDEINQAVLNVLDSTQFIMGQEVKTLEETLAHFCGTKHALACSSGTDALLLALMAYDIGPGDEVITSPFTFIATAEVIAFLRATPVFVDIDPANYNLDPTLLEAAITPKTKAIMPVSLYGQCPDMDAINAIAQKHGIPVIEDGAQSFGATYKGKKSCALSTIGCTSFFPSKPLGCYGDGGAIFTDDDALAKKMRILLNHGQEERYKHEYVGINGRLDTIQAAVLNVKLAYFDDEVKARERIGARYSQLLKDVLITPALSKDCTSVYAQYSVRVPNREEVAKVLNEAGIPTAIHYPIPLHLQPAFTYLGYKEGDFPLSEAIAKEIMSLPMSPFLTEEQQDMVVGALKETLC